MPFRSTVLDDAGDNHAVVDDDTDVPREDLVEVIDDFGTQHFNVVCFKKRCQPIEFPLAVGF